MIARPRLLSACLVICAGLAGCAATDTYSRPGTWHPDGANAANIAAMAAHPLDLARGRGLPGSDGILAVRAIDRLRDAVPPTAAGATDGGATGGGATGGGATGGPSAFAAPVMPTSAASGSP